MKYLNYFKINDCVTNKGDVFRGYRDRCSIGIARTVETRKSINEEKLPDALSIPRTDDVSMLLISSHHYT